MPKSEEQNIGKKWRACKACRGQGKVKDKESGKMEACPTCDGERGVWLYLV
jgi:DnaJ-class molecular chaperone